MLSDTMRGGGCSAAVATRWSPVWCMDAFVVVPSLTGAFPPPLRPAARERRAKTAERRLLNPAREFCSVESGALLAMAEDEQDVEVLRRKLREKEKLLEVQNVRQPLNSHRARQLRSRFQNLRHPFFFLSR